MADTKPWYLSKTLWFSVALAMLGALEAQAQIIPDEYRGGVLMIVAGISAILRFATTQPVGK